MFEKNQLSKSSDKNLKNSILNKHLKILSPINASKYKKHKISIDSNLSKDKIYLKTNSLLDKNIKIKKNSLDNKTKYKSNKSMNKYILKEKITIKCKDENQIKPMKPKESCKSSNKLNIFIEEVSQNINFDMKTNYFNKQYKRTEQHSNSLKLNKQNELVNKINKFIKESKKPSKFIFNKKDNKPTILSPINSICSIKKKLDFTSLAFENKEKPINYIDSDNSSKEDDKSGEHLEENNSSNNGSFEKEDKKIVIKTNFKMPNKKSSDFSESDEDKKAVIKTKFKNPHKKSSDFSESDEDKKEIQKKENKKGKKKKLKFKLKGDINNFRPPRKMSFQPKEDKILDKNIIISSAITKPGLNDDEEKTNQDSYLIKENIFGENFNIYGVFDGHGDDGHFVSRYISKYINDYYTNESIFIKDNSSLSKNKIFLEKYQQIIRESIKELDTKLTTTKINFDILHSGSTSVLLFLIDETLICSNIGDSQCYLFNCSNEDLWTFESLAKIHKPSDEEEKKRIIECGGEVHPYFDEDGVYDGPDRVYAKNKTYPGLSLSRSIGDLDGKDVGVISDPDIIVKKIDENSKFIILGSDGLWDVIKPYDVIRIVRSYFIKGDIDGACKILLNKAMQIWKKNNEERDDITIIVIFLGKPNVLLKEEKNNLLYKINENANEDSSRNNSSNQNPLVLNLD